jgi:hypothetical protein
LIHEHNVQDNEKRRTAEDLIANPFGPAVGGEELRATAPNNLDVLFFSMLLKSHLRVANMTDADVILVPFWMHKLIKLDQEIEKPNK